MAHVTQPLLSASVIQDGRALAVTYLTALVPLTVTTMVPALHLPLMKTLWYATAVTPTWGRSVNYGVTMVSLSTLMVHGYVSVILVTPVWTVPSNVTILLTSVRMVSVTADLVRGGVIPVKCQGAMGIMKTVLDMETVMVSQVYVYVTQDGLVLVAIYQTALEHQTVTTEACVCQRNQLQNVETARMTSLVSLSTQENSSVRVHIKSHNFLWNAV